MDNRYDSGARFFKIMLPFTTNLFKLRIPSKFVEKYSQELDKIVRLSDRVGGVWCVRLEKANDTIWFHHGWDKFVKDHSVGDGFFIVFKYTGNSNFNVRVFDTTSTEAIYNSISNANPSSSRIQTRERAACKKPSFIVVLKPYNFSRRFMYMPREFYMEYMSSTLPETVELCDGDGNKWEVRVFTTKGERSNFRCGFMRGLSEFLKAKNLKVGDTCVFELIHSNKLNVSTTYGSV